MSLKNDQLDLGIGFSQNGNLQTTLFVGAPYNSYVMNIYAQIYDANGAFQTCYLNQTITVFPEEESLTQLCMNDIISGDTSNSINQILYEGSYLDSLQEIQRISSEMNLQSLQDKLGVILNSSRIIKCHTMYNINLNIFF